LRQATSQQPEALQLSQAKITITHPVIVMDAAGNKREIQLANERPLNLYVNRQELVTLMTLGTDPEALCIGYLRNQGLISSLTEIKAVQVDWSVESAAIQIHQPLEAIDNSKKIVTTGCGQGSMHEKLYAQAESLQITAPDIRHSALLQLLSNLRTLKTVYREAGSVHGCALCDANGTILEFIEDVGRHNAVDTIAGLMLLHNISGANTMFYSTGRLTTEMVLKAAQMGIPTLLSRSGTTYNGVELAKKLGITLIGRLRANHLLAYHQGEKIIFST
jgi:FdhD protein